MSSDNTELDSSEKIQSLKEAFERNGEVSGEDLQFMFAYIDGLEIALAFSAGDGMTQEESDALNDQDQNYGLEQYIIEGIASKAVMNK